VVATIFSSTAAFVLLFQWIGILMVNVNEDDLCNGTDGHSAPDPEVSAYCNGLRVVAAGVFFLFVAMVITCVLSVIRFRNTSPEEVNKEDMKPDAV